MSQKIKVILADSSEDFLEAMTCYINIQEDLSVVAAAVDGERAVSLVRALRPQVLVTDILLRRLDGIEMLKELKHSGDMPHTIVLSAFLNDSIVKEINALGVNYCFSKPCRLSDLAVRIRECTCGETCQPGQQCDSGYDTEIAEAMINFGVMPHLQGYRYLREAIRRTINDPNTLSGVTKVLYPELAKAYKTTPKCVERSMRSALDTAWEHGDASRRNDYFGEMTMLLSKRPTNSEFISMVTEFILLRKRKERFEELAAV